MASIHRARGAVAGAAVLVAAAAAATAGAASASAQEGGHEIGVGHVTVASPWRTLKPLADEMVPAVQCPASHPWLIDQDYAPAGTHLIRGVEVRQERFPWPIGITVNIGTYEAAGNTRYYLGISDDPLASSAMNWSFEDQRYQVVLHCTDSRAEASSYVPGPRW